VAASAATGDLNQDNLVLIDRRIQQAAYAITYIRGAHLVKFGGEYRWSKSDRVTANGVDPQFNFNGQFSGNAYADFRSVSPSVSHKARCGSTRSATRATPSSRRTTGRPIRT
jgi:hypothetical protein